MICDFCSGPDPIWEYPAQSFSLTINNMAHASDGNWAVCQKCHVLILEKKWDGIVERAMDNFYARHPGLPRFSVEMPPWRKWIMAFLANQTGPPRKLRA